jgi:hypothetical protein
MPMAENTAEHEPLHVPLQVAVRDVDVTDDEVVAIVAAVEVCWPRPAAESSSTGGEPARWRFSGRWWTKPVPLRRERPTSYLRSS